MRIVCVSDTHGSHDALELPAGDVLLHAGDITAHGSETDYRRFLDWFARQPFRHRVFVAGNHDTWLESWPRETAGLAEAAGVVYLDDARYVADGLRIWGSPITPRFHDWAFMRDPGADIERHWAMIPPDTDVLLTHGPPYAILDRVERTPERFEHTGCPSLLARVQQIEPAYHVFGHIHEEYGAERNGRTCHLNVSSMDKGYSVVNPPVIIDFDPARR